MLIGRKLNSLRHRRGFGIHSPFAFRFVTEVLCQRLPYYAYSTIGNDRRVRLLMRLCVELAPATVALLIDSPAPYAAAVAAASRETAIIGDDAELTVADAAASTPEALEALARSGRHMMLINLSRERAATIQAAIPTGMTFYNLHGTLIAVARPHLPRQDFDVAF